MANLDDPIQTAAEDLQAYMEGGDAANQGGSASGADAAALASDCAQADPDAAAAPGVTSKQMPLFSAPDMPGFIDTTADHEEPQDAPRQQHPHTRSSGGAPPARSASSGLSAAAPAFTSSLSVSAAPFTLRSASQPPAVAGAASSSGSGGSQQGDAPALSRRVAAARKAARSIKPQLRGLLAAADHTWSPHATRESFLVGSLAKHLLVVGARTGAASDDDGWLDAGVNTTAAGACAVVQAAGVQRAAVRRGATG